jgi:hypothetical protein
MRTAASNPVGILRFPESRGFPFKNGSVVPVRVLKALAPGKWAIGVGGRVFSARSDVALEPGRVLQARVFLAGDGTVSLHIEPHAPDPIAAFLAKEGLPDETIFRTLIGAFLRHQRPLDPFVLKKASRHLSRGPRDGERDTANLAVLDDKGWDVDTPSTKVMLELLDYGRKHRDCDRRGRRGREGNGTEELREAIRESFREDRGDTGPLQVFNHRKGSHGTWVVAPFRLEAGQKEYRGTLRFFQDSVSRKTECMVLNVHSNTGNEWSFHLPLAGKSRKLSLYCGPEAARRWTQRNLAVLESDFRNIGVEVDDIIHGIEEFDGFSEVRERGSMPGIDMVT